MLQRCQCALVHYNKLLLLKYGRACRRSFSVHYLVVSDSHSVGNDRIDGSGNSPLSRDRLRREACRICARSACYAHIVPNDVSLRRSCGTRLREQSSPCRIIRCTRCTCNGVSRVRACVKPGGDSLGPRLAARRDPTHR